MSGSMRLTEEQRRMVASALARIAFDIRSRQNDFIELDICPDLVERMGFEADEFEGLANAFRIADAVRVEYGGAA